MKKREKELKAPMKCGHPYACWTPGVVVFDSIDVLNREKTKMPYCAWCAETAKLQAPVDAPITKGDGTVGTEQIDVAEASRRLFNQSVSLNKLQAEIAELRAGAAAVMEKAIALCQQYAEQYSDYRSGASYCAHKLAFLIPADSRAALAERVKAAYTSGYIDGADKVLAKLEAEAGETKTKENK